jgi:hypothetical protein
VRSRPPRFDGDFLDADRLGLGGFGIGGGPGPALEFAEQEAQLAEAGDVGLGGDGAAEQFLDGDDLAVLEFGIGRPEELLRLADEVHAGGLRSLDLLRFHDVHPSSAPGPALF